MLANKSREESGSLTVAARGEGSVSEVMMVAKQYRSSAKHTRGTYGQRESYDHLRGCRHKHPGGCCTDLSGDVGREQFRQETDATNGQAALQGEVLSIITPYFGSLILARVLLVSGTVTIQLLHILISYLVECCRPLTTRLDLA